MAYCPTYKWPIIQLISSHWPRKRVVAKFRPETHNRRTNSYHLFVSCWDHLLFYCSQEHG